MGYLKEKLQAANGKPLIVASGLLTAIFNTVALLLIAREMGAELLGTLGFLLSFVGLVYFIGDLGNDLAFEKLMASGHKFNDCFRVFSAIKLKLTILMGAVSGLLIALYVYVLAPDGTGINPVSMFIILGYFIVANLAQIWVVGLSVKGQEMQSKSYDLIEGLIKVVLVWGIVWLALTGGDDQKAIFQLSVIYLLAGAMGMLIIWNSSKKWIKGETHDEIVQGFSEISKKLMPFIAFTGLVLTLDKVLLWYFTEPEIAFETLGLFFGAQRITIFIAASAVSIQSLLGSALSHYIKIEDNKSISGALRMTERYVSLMALPVASFYVMFSGDLLNAFLGPEFSVIGVAVSILAGAGFFTAMASPHMAYLLKAGKTRELTVVAGLSFFVMVAGLLLLLPDLILLGQDVHGINGAAISILLSAASGYFAARYYSWKLLGCKIHRGIFRHLFCAAQMIVVINFLIWYFDIVMGVKWILIFALIGTFVYGLGLYLSGEMLKEEFVEFKDLTSSE